MVVDVGEVGPRRMASATLRHAHPYSDRATVLSQCHDGASGGSLLGVSVSESFMRDKTLPLPTCSGIVK